MELGLQGKVVVLTGAAGGIGRPTAELFAAEGAHLVCVDRESAPLQQLVASLPGPEHLALAADLHDPAAASAVIERTVAQLGRVDVVAHLAALMQTVDIDDVTEEQWSEHMAVNVTATFFLARAAGSAMKRRGQGGRLIVMTSGAWLSGGLETRLPYAATKGAVTTMVRSLAKAYGPFGITVNAVAPGLIETAMMRDGLSAERRSALIAATPLGRFGEPSEIASVVVFLASTRSSFVSGATVNVSGAYTLY